MKFNLPKMPKFPKSLKFPHFPRLKLKPVKKIIPLLIKHKVLTIVSILLILFITLAMWYRGHLISQMKSVTTNTGDELFHSTSSSTPVPTFVLPSPSETSSTVLGASSYNAPDYYIPPYISPTPFPTFPPLPTLVPVQNTNATSTGTASTNNSSGNSNCNTGDGVPNAWYSDVYPNPPITANTGSVELVVVLRDCNVKTAPVSDNIKISLNSGDPNTKIDGNNLPYTLIASNGQASFHVSSGVAGTVTLLVEDTTKSFTITNIQNHNPVITFTGTGSSSGNSNCTTGPGVPNAWYSDVYPASPVSANTGSTVTFTVILRDCNKNTVSVSDSLTFSQTSNDSSVTVNGSSPPGSRQAQNGQATFDVSSPNAGTDTFTIQDTTNSFTITDTNNHNPSVVFSASSTTAPTATSAPTNTQTPNLSPTNAPTAIPSQTVTSTSAPTQSGSPTSTLTPVLNQTGG